MSQKGNFKFSSISRSEKQMLKIQSNIKNIKNMEMQLKYIERKKRKSHYKLPTSLLKMYFIDKRKFYIETHSRN